MIELQTKRTDAAFCEGTQLAAQKMLGQRLRNARAARVERGREREIDREGERDR